MTTGTVSLERRGHVLVIGLDRAAKRNAFDLPLWDALCRAYGELDRDDDLRVGVLHAHGEHFAPERLQIVVVGDPVLIDPPLAALQLGPIVALDAATL